MSFERIGNQQMSDEITTKILANGNVILERKQYYKGKRSLEEILTEERRKIRTRKAKLNNRQKARQKKLAAKVKQTVSIRKITSRRVGYAPVRSYAVC